MIDILETVRKDQGELVALRRHFHEHPELSKQEDQTLAYIAETLKGYGISYRIIDKGGLIAWIDGKGPGKTLLLRADVDALPIEEGLETTVILAYGKTAALSTRTKQFMNHIIRNYPKYREG